MGVFYDLKLIIVQECIYDPLFWKKRHFLFFDFACKTDSEDVKLNHEGQDYKWVNSEEALKMDVDPYTLKVIKEYLK